jgi:hypothetical protein
MTPTTIIKRAAQTTLLCTGLVTASAVWSCPEEAAAVNASNPHAAQAQTPSVVVGAQPTTLSRAQLYAVLHDPALNKPDGLANYAEDYRARYPH